MIKEMLFPEKLKSTKDNEWLHHYKFVKDYGKLAGIKVSVVKNNKDVFCGNGTYFSVLLDGKQAIFDYSDHPKYQKKYAHKDIAYFKYHYMEKYHKNIGNFFPVGPMLDIDLIENYEYFFNYIKCNIYEPTDSNIILNVQRPRHKALERRTRVQEILKNKYGDDAKIAKDFKLDEQRYFWDLHMDCVCAVSVPGARETMLDRGHLEEIFMGICIVSPPIDTILPYFRRLKDGVNSIFCNKDYSDLTKKIDWIKNCRKEAKQIGNNAKELTKNFYMPDKYWIWILSCLKKVYGDNI